MSDAAAIIYPVTTVLDTYWMRLAVRSIAPRIKNNPTSNSKVGTIDAFSTNVTIPTVEKVLSSKTEVALVGPSTTK